MVKKATQSPDYRAKWDLGVLQTSGTTHFRAEQGREPGSFAPGAFSAGEDVKDLKVCGQTQALAPAPAQLGDVEQH